MNHAGNSLEYPQVMHLLFDLYEEQRAHSVHEDLEIGEIFE